MSAAETEPAAWEKVIARCRAEMQASLTVNDPRAHAVIEPLEPLGGGPNFAVHRYVGGPVHGKDQRRRVQDRTIFPFQCGSFWNYQQIVDGRYEYVCTDPWGRRLMLYAPRVRADGSIA